IRMHLRANPRTPLECDQEPSSPWTQSGSTQHLGSGTRRSCPVRQSRLESISFPQFSFVVPGLTAPQGCPAGGLPKRGPTLSAPTIHNSHPVKNTVNRHPTAVVLVSADDQRFEHQIGVVLLHALQPPPVREQRKQFTVRTVQHFAGPFSGQGRHTFGSGAPGQREVEPLEAAG